MPRHQGGQEQNVEQNSSGKAAAHAPHLGREHKPLSL
jgi:hypothetical protein